MKLCWSSNWVERVEANAFCSGGRDSRHTIGQMRTSRLCKCQFFILCKYILSISKWITNWCNWLITWKEVRSPNYGLKINLRQHTPLSFQIGQFGEPANVEIGWKRQKNKKTANVFSFPVFLFQMWLSARLLVCMISRASSTDHCLLWYIKSFKQYLPLSCAPPTSREGKLSRNSRQLTSTWDFRQNPNFQFPKRQN